MSVYQNIREVQKQLELNNTAFGKIVGKTKTNIANTISGKSVPKIDMIVRMKDEYPSLNLNWLFTGHGPMWLDKDSLPDYNIQRIKDLEKLVLSYERQLELLEKEVEKCKEDLRKYNKNYGKAAG